MRSSIDIGRPLPCAFNIGNSTRGEEGRRMDDVRVNAIYDDDAIKTLY